MNDLRTAAQQALEDLKDLHKNHNITYAGTIAALEAALAQEQAALVRADERERIAAEWDGCMYGDLEDVDIGAAIRARSKE